MIEVSNQIEDVKRRTQMNIATSYFYWSDKTEGKLKVLIERTPASLGWYIADVLYYYSGESVDDFDFDDDDCEIMVHIKKYYNSYNPWETK